MGDDLQGSLTIGAGLGCTVKTLSNDQQQPRTEQVRPTALQREAVEASEPSKDSPLDPAAWFSQSDGDLSHTESLCKYAFADPVQQEQQAAPCSANTLYYTHLYTWYSLLRLQRWQLCLLLCRLFVNLLQCCMVPFELLFDC